MPEPPGDGSRREASALLNGDFNLADIRGRKSLLDSGQILTNCVADILHGFVLGFTLRPAARKSWATNSITFLRLMQHNRIPQAHGNILHSHERETILNSDLRSASGRSRHCDPPTSV